MTTSGRTPAVLAREQNLYLQRVDELRGEEGDPQFRDETPLSVEELVAALDETEPQTRNAAAFVAGRCGLEDDRIDARLRAILEASDPRQLDSRALAFIEAAMSLALRGDVDTGAGTLRAVLADDAAGSMADWLAASYLAQLGDPSGFPTMVKLLDGTSDFDRLQAARHLVAFVPFDGTTVGTETVDVCSRLRDRLDDRDELVSVEIPGLLVESCGEAARSALQAAAKKSRHKATKQAAERALQHLDER